MLINIVCIESSRPDWARQAFKSYQSKFNKSIKISWKGCKPIQRNKNYDVERAIKDESNLLLSSSKKEDVIISLDKDGKGSLGGHRNIQRRKRITLVRRSPSLSVPRIIITRTFITEFSIMAPELR